MTQSHTDSIFEQMLADDYEQLICFQNRAAGLRGFLAIHDTTQGPALGGVRLWTYANESDALTDALRLSRAMTYKAAISELPCGGGKTVILLHDGLQRTEAFEAFGQLVESLRGRYFTARDVNITDDDLGAIARRTRYVAKEPSPELGDICEHTAVGVWHGMRACLEFAGLKKARVAVQGVGGVGLILARILHREGMELLVADLDAARAKVAEEECSARIVPPDEILFADCDVVAPCALGGVMNAATIARLKAPIVCGSANNVLAAVEDGDALARRGILYAPDYLVNAGGLIRGAEVFLLNRKSSWDTIERIHPRMLRVLQLAKEERISTARVADQLAAARLKRPKKFADLHWGKA
jgi:leucine dehydrogenase